MNFRFVISRTDLESRTGREKGIGVKGASGRQPDGRREEAKEGGKGVRKGKEWRGAFSAGAAESGCQERIKQCAQEKRLGKVAWLNENNIFISIYQIFITGKVALLFAILAGLLL